MGGFPVRLLDEIKSQRPDIAVSGRPPNKSVACQREYEPKKKREEEKNDRLVGGNNTRKRNTRTKAVQLLLDGVPT
jgi:hypothetical protein